MISVIIPVINEEENLSQLLSVLSREAVEHETIVVDGGSADSTVQVAQAHGARVLTSMPGRGQQICRGVREASGDTFLFLHADSIFPRGGLKSVSAMLAADPEIAGGNFRLLFDGDTPFSRWLTGFYAKIRRVGLYYGDSGIFVRRTAYDALGGIRPIALMEDLDFVRRLERRGQTVCIREPALVTSARRFEGRRASAIVFGWLKLHFLFYLGVSPERLAKMYGTHKARAPVGNSIRPDYR